MGDGQAAQPLKRRKLCGYCGERNWDSSVCQTVA